MTALAGNRCGHDPRRPRLKLQRADDETRGKPFPWLIAQLLARAEWLYWDRDLFPELGARKRSERIEAMVLVLKALGRNMDILTMRCGKADETGAFHGIPMPVIAGWAQISVQRAYRACWDIRDAGWAGGSQPIEKRHAGKCTGRCPRGSHRGQPSIRTIKPELFERLKLRGALKRERGARAQAARPSMVETIAQRRQLRRLAKLSARAGTLATRTVEQLAGAAGDPGKKGPYAGGTWTEAEGRAYLAARLRDRG